MNIMNLSTIPRILLVMAAVVAVGGFTRPQVMIYPLHHLHFGDVERGVALHIPYSEEEAAQFEIIGAKGAGVRITVQEFELSHDEAVIPVTITNGDVAFSRDGGLTWETFSTGHLYHETTFPAGENGVETGTILIRIGGTIVTSATQQRYKYQGEGLLRVEYLDF
jgi:hypothetical protein